MRNSPRVPVLICCLLTSQLFSPAATNLLPPSCLPLCLEAPPAQMRPLYQTSHALSEPSTPTHPSAEASQITVFSTSGSFAEPAQTKHLRQAALKRPFKKFVEKPFILLASKFCAARTCRSPCSQLQAAPVLGRENESILTSLTREVSRAQRGDQGADWQAPSRSIYCVSTICWTTNVSAALTAASAPVTEISRSAERSAVRSDTCTLAPVI
jgi:hypothetical protein